MKRGAKRAAAASAVALAWAISGGGPALAAEVPPLVGHQGRLYDAGTGKPIDGELTVTFAVYESQITPVALWIEAHQVSFIAIIRRLGCPSGHGFNGGWPVSEPADRSQMFHGHGNSGAANYERGPVKGANGWLLQTQGSNGTACQISVNTGNGAQPVWCCVNRASNL
ncbi:MAG: hypothetical protein HY744_04915 [Deltaproteobacteria bacterium]|nr:hypothetical protein [Deltaproteobacteria bacterium]